MSAAWGTLHVMSLPTVSTRKEATNVNACKGIMEMANTVNVSQRTCDVYLPLLCNNEYDATC